jgi:hypothetical protein
MKSLLIGVYLFEPYEEYDFYNQRNVEHMHHGKKNLFVKRGRKKYLLRLNFWLTKVLALHWGSVPGFSWVIWA